MIAKSSISDGSIQALATVVAVLLGFGLSVFAERRAWARRKTEQLRDKQLSALVSVSGAVEDFLAASETVDEGLLASRYGPAVSASAVVQRAEAEQLVDTMLVALDAGIRQIRRFVNELRILQFSDDGLSLANACLSAAIRLRNAAGSSSAYLDLDERRLELRAAVDALMSSALRGLHA